MRRSRTRCSFEDMFEEYLGGCAAHVVPLIICSRNIRTAVLVMMIALGCSFEDLTEEYPNRYVGHDDRSRLFL